MISIGKHDDLPGTMEEQTGTLGDTTITLDNAVYESSVTHVRRVVAIDASDNLYHVTINGLTSTDTVHITAPSSGSATECTYYILYIAASDMSDTWAADIESATESDYVPIKATNLVNFTMGGHVTGSSTADYAVTGGERLRCSLRGDITLSIDPQAEVLVCADGVDDNAGNIVVTKKAKSSIAFSRIVYDMYLQWLAEHPEDARAAFPIYFKYETALPSDAAVAKQIIEVLIPRVKLTSANPQSMNDEIGHTLQPVILDDGSGLPAILIRYTEEAA